ncbi:metal-binding protein ZinT [Paracoccus sp. (in: a-proteobacteria)]|uniref:metal-binding protein ZinT n=1 Tax=Paracoccus sp. TaxID=267 RepID=UPI0026E039FF|nr:metal-binding protein ZinT [Paracoccus sp. (in: a-proteobacteria)]MDO5648170.1 metal-binding protein ZinT [Paracoccus sp. (in: a-proteobacteria)]
MNLFRLSISSLAVAMIALTAPAMAHSTKAGHSHSHAHHDEKSVYKGYFDDAQIQPRDLSDWAGEWQSVYPLLTAGTLDPVMVHKAEHGSKTAEEYRAYYDIGYKTGVDRITIDGATVTFYGPEGAVSGDYVADGYEILTYSRGNRGVRFVFAKAAGDDAAPGYIQFSDHRIAPETSDHYHLYWGDDRAKLLEELTNWPTYYPAALSADEIVREMMAH